MKRFILTFAILALITSCKTQSTIHIPPSTIIKDSVSVTYRQGVVVSLAENAELAEQESAASQAQSSPKAQHDGLASHAQRCYSARPLQIPQKVRVDTLIVERWHTQTIPSTIHNPPSTIPRFYKNCTWGFFILILLLLGRIAFKLFRLFYLHR